MFDIRIKEWEVLRNLIDPGPQPPEAFVGNINSVEQTHFTFLQTSMSIAYEEAIDPFLILETICAAWVSWSDM